VISVTEENFSGAVAAKIGIGELHAFARGESTKCEMMR